MNDWYCTFCGHVYDQKKGDPEQEIRPGTPFEDLPVDFRCPGCSYGKELYEAREDDDGQLDREEEKVKRQIFL